MESEAIKNKVVEVTMVGGLLLVFDPTVPVGKVKVLFV
jgi:hypothetical protein